MPTFKNKNSLTVFAIIQKMMFAIRGKLTIWPAVAQIQPICYVTSAIFSNRVTSIYAYFC